MLKKCENTSSPLGTEQWAPVIEIPKGNSGTKKKMALCSLLVNSFNNCMFDMPDIYHAILVDTVVLELTQNVACLATASFTEYLRLANQQNAPLLSIIFTKGFAIVHSSRWINHAFRHLDCQNTQYIYFSVMMDVSNKDECFGDENVQMNHLLTPKLVQLSSPLKPSNRDNINCSSNSVGCLKV